MNARQLAACAERLQKFLTTMLAGMGRAERCHHGSLYVQGLHSFSIAARFEYASDQLPPPPFTAYGLQSIIQHVAHFPMGSGTAC